MTTLWRGLGFLSPLSRLAPLRALAAAPQQRGAHSKRVLKRMWGTRDRPHPARARRERNDRIRRGLPADPPALPPPALPRFAATHAVPSALANGWLPPHAADAPPPAAELPFRVSRTPAGQFLPVYSKYVAQRSVTLTVVRRIEGDVDVCADELARVVTASTGAGRLVPVRKRLGSIEVPGNHVRHVRNWLASLGF